MDHCANCFHLSFCSWSRHVCLRGSFELRSSRLYFFKACAFCPQFDALAKTLQEQLSGVKVYKVGDEPEKQVYLVGKAPDGRWAGLKTTVVGT